MHYNTVFLFQLLRYSNVYFNQNVPNLQQVFRWSRATIVQNFKFPAQVQIQEVNVSVHKLPPSNNPRGYSIYIYRMKSKSLASQGLVLGTWSGKRAQYSDTYTTHRIVAGKGLVTILPLISEVSLQPEAPDMLAKDKIHREKAILTLHDQEGQKQCEPRLQNR